MLPVVFFVVAYFGMTVSGEDIFQGAGNYSNGVEINVAEDAAEAFRHNGRITDMYAWTVIDFFDYQFQWGPDAILRLLDVAMASGVFYLMAMVVMGRKPKLVVKDALIYDVGFAMMMLTQHGRVFYAGFSAIHNYMVAVCIMMVFAVPYLMTLWGRKVGDKHSIVWAIGMAVVGVVFGMSSAIAPIAFAIVTAVYGVAMWKKEKIRMSGWMITGVIGMIVGICVSNFAGPSLDFYTSNEAYVETYDYVSVVGVMAEPVDGIVRMAKHLAVNFGRVMAPIAICAVVVAACVRDARAIFSKKYWREMDKNRKRVLVACGMFAVIAVLGAVQVNAPLRILLPAYVAGVVAMLVVLEPCVRSRIIGWGIAVAVSVIVATKTILTIEYHQRAGEILDEIRKSDVAEMCMEKERVKAKNLPVVYLGQEDMLAEWAMPETVYVKTVSYCE